MASEPVPVCPWPRSAGRLPLPPAVRPPTRESHSRGVRVQWLTYLCGSTLLYLRWWEETGQGRFHWDALEKTEYGVASSRIIIFGSATIARAMVIICRWP